MQTFDSNSLQQLTKISYLIANDQHELANQLLDSFVPEDDISRLCAQSLRERNKVAVPIYVEKPDADDKQINVFDLVLKAVPPVRILSHTALNIMNSVYGSGVPSFTHFNIGIGKGHFEVQMLRELASQPDKLPRKIRIIGVDVDQESLRETGISIQRVVDELYPATTQVEYIPICAFAERLNEEIWGMIKNHGTEMLCVISAFTLHHIPTLDDRDKILKQIADCDPLLFILLEPDADHFTPDLPERLRNCWNIFGTIFKLVDQTELHEREAEAIKYTFFGREIKDILGNEEGNRSEKHERARFWARRLKDAGFNLHRLVTDANHPMLDITYEEEHNFATTHYEGIPMVAIMTASKQV